MSSVCLIKQKEHRETDKQLTNITPFWYEDWNISIDVINWNRLSQKKPLYLIIIELSILNVKKNT